MACCDLVCRQKRSLHLRSRSRLRRRLRSKSERTACAALENRFLDASSVTAKSSIRGVAFRFFRFRFRLFSVFSVSFCVSCVCVRPSGVADSSHGPIENLHNKEISTIRQRHLVVRLASSCHPGCMLCVINSSMRRQIFVSSAFVVASSHRGHSGHWHQSYVSWWFRCHFGSWLSFRLLFVRSVSGRPACYQLTRIRLSVIPLSTWEYDRCA